MLIKVGADPEVFVRDSQGRPVSAVTPEGVPMVLGTKAKPAKVHKGAFQVDGTALEFNIDPAATKAEFIANINAVYGQMRARIKRGFGYDVVADPVVVYDKDYFARIPDSAKELGCDPDFCAWTGEANPRPDGLQTTMRTGSGHIHIGWTEGADPTSAAHFADCMAIAKQMDYYLGIYSLLWDSDDDRRILYGKAGAFRPKPYGVEYRTMSNAWLRYPALYGWIFDAVQKGMADAIEGRWAEAECGELAKEAIDTGDRDWRSWMPYDTGLVDPMKLLAA